VICFCGGETCENATTYPVTRKMKKKHYHQQS
jgi:hypothetical protein